MQASGLELVTIKRITAAPEIRILIQHGIHRRNPSLLQIAKQHTAVQIITVQIIKLHQIRRILLQITNQPPRRQGGITALQPGKPGQQCMHIYRCL